MRELYHVFFHAYGMMKNILAPDNKTVIDQLTRSQGSGRIGTMISTTDIPRIELPDRFCTWCKVLMTKRLVGGKQFIHYTCPKCIFQHTRRLEKKS
jgi:hypothetical protein